MVNDVINNWDADRVDCPSTSVPKLITILRGGESITLKSMESSSDQHYIGSDRQMTPIRSYQLNSGETVTLTLPDSFGKDNAIEIWALPTNAGRDICYFKLFGKNPQTEASG